MKNFIYQKEGADYPRDFYFRPSQEYPEYRYMDLGLSEEKNDVYDMIRSMFLELELDKEHIGQKCWNPLGEYVHVGDTVLIKPNLVKHCNDAIKGKRGLDCLITHPSVIRCIVDYVLIALNGTGKIIVADAPIQSCDFERLKRYSGISAMEKFYKRAGENIVIEDLRNYASIRKKGHVVNQSQTFKYKGKIINLGKYSYFFNNEKKGRLRITNYDYREVNRHHEGNRQEYCISEACLDADVVINLPKPKTHRKAGYTGALKNMVGVSALKEFLPHHTKGSYIKGDGDEYYLASGNAKAVSDMNDVIDILDKKSLFMAGTLIRKLEKRFYNKSLGEERYSEGSWWGNDTIWKTILDLNLIVMYADKDGKLKNSIQRKIITLGDMIIAGEKEGPLCPSPKKKSTLIFADNSVLFDEILVRFMGFNEENFILLKEAGKSRKLTPFKVNDCLLQSNIIKYKICLNDLKEEDVFVPTEGWRELLSGNSE